ncbi:hypothetical protein DITRI_Ditri02bG0079400 [Diplodiscus trichospermus]
MATKTLTRTGASPMNRLMVNPILIPNPIPNRIANQAFQITPQLFPSRFKPQPSLHLPQNDADFLSNVSSLGFLYPTGLPSLRFFLPDALKSSGKTEINQASQCSHFPKEHMSLVSSGARGVMDILLDLANAVEPLVEVL